MIVVVHWQTPSGGTAKSAIRSSMYDIFIEACCVQGHINTPDDECNWGVVLSSLHLQHIAFIGNVNT